MLRTWVQHALVTLGALLLLCGDSAARTQAILVGSDIPASYFIGAGFIFEQSDSLYLNHQLLVRGTDYTFDARRMAFDLSRLKLTGSDTLMITYHALPSWIKATYGQPVPEITSGGSPPVIPAPVAPPPGERSGGSSDISITGAKSFRFTSRTAGASDFGQSLDLKLSGHLTPGLTITGAVSDRGYDPSYGTANSRLNEIDKINLQLLSRTLTAQIGDIQLTGPGFGSAAAKRVSGAALDLHERTWRLNAAAARPKGRFKTAQFMGRDGQQGPYQIGEGTQVSPIVPNSETVWLDGRRLEKGTNKDYEIDYPTGRIIFNVNHPIDQRSRIEIDYEPLATDYKEELFAVGGGLAARDSSVAVNIGWLREGDDRNEPQAGELSREDLDSLEAAGDETYRAVRTGVRPDSLGPYDLIVDSLPDTVYQYVGEGNGQYAITFSFFGAGLGDYLFLGNGRYQYAGPGKGDYRPYVIIAAPQRTDYYYTELTAVNRLFGRLSALVQQTQFDKNTLSGRDDGDNGGLFYEINLRKNWRITSRDNFVQIKTRRKEASFNARQRLYNADFTRDYLLPAGYAALTDESWHEFNASLSPDGQVTVTPSFSRLTYERSFRADAAGSGIFWRPFTRGELSARWRSVRTELDSLGDSREGRVDTYAAGLRCRPGRFDLSSGYEYDYRRNEYDDTARGTRYHRVTSTVGLGGHKLTYEYHLEDTLQGSWRKELTRHRLSGESTDRFGNLFYNTTMTYQWIRRPDVSENNFLGRLNLQYNDLKHQLNVNSSYAISDETRNSRGVNYLEVAAGEGNYRLEDGEYVPDPDGNYIKVEEILSEQERVRRGDKSFYVSKGWSKAVIRFNSNVQEELLPDGNREFWWAVPFLTDSRQPYLFYLRRYDTDLRFFPLTSGHAVNLSYSGDLELRYLSGQTYKRKDDEGSVVLKQVLGRHFLEQRLALFRKDRDAYFGAAGKLDGYKTGIGYRYQFRPNELSAETSFRKARSDTDESVTTYAITVGARIQVITKGELRSSIELYSQTLSGATETVSWLLTDNRPGTRGAIWSVALRYGVGRDMRINFNLSGRHSDNRTARLTARGEFVAGF